MPNEEKGSEPTTEGPRQVTRAELYELVWSAPMRRVAERFGISDVALAKTCRRLGVPTPGRGYWQKVRAGKRVKPRRLGPRPKDAPESVMLGRVVQPHADTIADTVDRAKRGESRPENRIVVRRTLRSAHPLVRRTAASLRSDPISRDGMLHPRGSECLDVRLSKASITRALLIYDALIRALEERGHSVRIKKHDRWRSDTVAVVDQE